MFIYATKYVAAYIKLCIFIQYHTKLEKGSYITITVLHMVNLLAILYYRDIYVHMIQELSIQL